MSPAPDESAHLHEFVAVSWGGGTNSTAMLIAMRDRGMRPSLVTFADTGGEKPHTYDGLPIIREWLAQNSFPDLTIVTKSGLDATLEANCERMEMLPSLAYGYKSCSLKWKVQPQEKFCNNYGPTKAIWKAGHKVTKYLGIDAGEAHRATKTEDKKYLYRYPLVEWDIDRDDCIELIKAEGLPLPGKSSCFYCPASKLPEILDLRDNYPELLERALAMEARAKLTSVKGLGRRFSWAEFLASDRPDLMRPPDDLPCGCHDG